MIYILENDQLKIKISSMGAELQSIRRTGDGTEYLWQGDPAFWSGRATNLFPVCGRSTEGRYTYRGQSYPMGIHGFARNREWAVVRQKTDVLTLQLTEDEESLAVYPFPFTAEITYTLEAEHLSVGWTVRNTGGETLYFSVGGHPGFNLPLTPGERFEDYYIAFDEPCEARRLCLSDAGYYFNSSEPFPLEEGQFLRLHHGLFDHDAIFLENTCRGVTLRSSEGARSVHLSFPDMPYVGFWQPSHTDAPFLCIEPWNGVPALDGAVDDLEHKVGTEQLEPGKIYRNTYVMSFG